jgi:hypothetical protein
MSAARLEAADYEATERNGLNTCTHLTVTRNGLNTCTHLTVTRNGLNTCTHVTVTRNGLNTCTHLTVTRNGLNTCTHLTVTAVQEYTLRGRGHFAFCLNLSPVTMAVASIDVWGYALLPSAVSKSKPSGRRAQPVVNTHVVVLRNVSGPISD